MVETIGADGARRDSSGSTSHCQHQTDRSEVTKTPTHPTLLSIVRSSPFTAPSVAVLHSRFPFSSRHNHAHENEHRSNSSTQEWLRFYFEHLRPPWLSLLCPLSSSVSFPCIYLRHPVSKACTPHCTFHRNDLGSSFSANVVRICFPSFLRLSSPTPPPLPLPFVLSHTRAIATTEVRQCLPEEKLVRLDSVLFRHLRMWRKKMENARKQMDSTKRQQTRSISPRHFH